MTEHNDLMTPIECATFLGVSEGTLMIWRCTKRYPLNFIKIGGRVRYRRSDVEQFLLERTVKCGPDAIPPIRRKRSIA
jgi:excisionase family DNA binding protein